jgi:hypothetical protein
MSTVLKNGAINKRTQRNYEEIYKNYSGNAVRNQEADIGG